MWLAAARATVLLWACELVLVRTSSMPAPWPDIWKSAVGLGALALGAPLAARLASRGSRSPIVGLVGYLPLTLVAGAVLLPVAEIGAARLPAAFGVAGIAALGVWRGRGGAPIPGVTTLVGTLAVATAAAWALQTDDPPPLERVAATGALWALLALLSLRPAALPLAVALALVVGRWPLAGPQVQWTATGEVSGPDLLLVTVDTLRGDASRSMESHRVLASRGLEFPHVLASSPWTLPSMATTMTGAEPAQHGATKRGAGSFGAIARELPTLAERLAARGYDTAAVTPINPFTGARFGFDRGFAVFDSARALGAHALPRSNRDATSARPAVVQLLYKHGLDQLHPVGSADQLVRRARSILERRRDRPLFLWIHFLDSHIPYRHADETSVLHWRELERTTHTDNLADPYWATEEGRAELWEAYRNEVAHVDRALLELLTVLERDTVIALLSDHGEEFFERGGFEHGHSFHKEVVEVAFVLARFGGAVVPEVVETPVGHLDVLPTLLGALDAADPSLPGRDLTRTREASVARISVNPLYGPDPEAAAVRDGRWKAIYGPGAGVQLYDLDRDPDEREDVSATRAGVAARLREAVADRARIEGGAATAPELSEHDRAALRALGYLDE